MKNIVTLVFFACSVFRRDILATVVKERYFSRKDWNCVNGLSFCQPAIRSKCKRRQILSQQYFSSTVRQFVIVFSILSPQHHHHHHWILFTTNWNTVSHFGSQKNVSKLPSLQVSQKFTCCRREKDWQHEEQVVRMEPWKKTARHLHFLFSVFSLLQFFHPHIYMFSEPTSLACWEALSCLSRVFPF